MGQYIGLELKRVLRDPVTLFFTAGLPAFMYLVFGASMSWGKYEIGEGNIAMYTLIGMAAYGAVTATTGVGGSAAVERMQGWGRQLGLTPLTDGQFVAVKTTVAVLVAALPIALIYGLGTVTGAKASMRVWVLSFVIVFVGAIMFALYGLCFGLAFRSEAAVGAASGSLVILGFLGNVFSPLSGVFLTIAKFTPLYGYVTLARRPLTDGSLDSTTGTVTVEPLWPSIVNVGVWTTLLAILAIFLVRRGRGRQ